MNKLKPIIKFVFEDYYDEPGTLWVDAENLINNEYGATIDFFNWDEDDDAQDFVARELVWRDKKESSSVVLEAEDDDGRYLIVIPEEYTNEVVMIYEVVLGVTLKYPEFE